MSLYLLVKYVTVKKFLYQNFSEPLRFSCFCFTDTITSYWIALNSKLSGTQAFLHSVSSTTGYPKQVSYSFINILLLNDLHSITCCCDICQMKLDLSDCCSRLVQSGLKKEQMKKRKKKGNAWKISFITGQR